MTSAMKIRFQGWCGSLVKTCRCVAVIGELVIARDCHTYQCPHCLFVCLYGMPNETTNFCFFYFQCQY